MSRIDAGANPDELDRLAGRLLDAAGTVGAAQRRLNPAVHSAPWFGANADRFRSRWNGEYRRSLLEAVAFLESQSQSLRRQASDQRRVSSTGARRSLHVTMPSWFPRIGRGVWDTLTRVTGGLDHVGAIVGLVAFVGSGAAVTGRYSKAWSSVIAAMPEGSRHLLRYKSSPVLQGLHRFLRPAGGVAGSVDRLLGPLGVVGGVMGIGGSTLDGYRALRGGDRLGAGLAGADVAASGLKMSKHPVTYLGGVTLQTWSEVGKAARDIDWSAEGMRQVYTASPKDWASALGEGVVGAAKKLPKILG